ncbi:MAG: hypothetical protein ACU0CA_05565 [Paracoccaceae bacterium]
MVHSWLNEAAQRYHSSNRVMLEWILSRPPLQGGFVDTKVNSISGIDYLETDGLRGPNFIYGWIQGRALEALATFTKHYRRTDPAFASRLEERARALFNALKGLHQRDGHIYFLYDKNIRPILCNEDHVSPQVHAPDIYTYSDAFAAKGFVVAADLFAPEQASDYLKYLYEVVDAIESGRFQMDESRELDHAQIAEQPDDFAPRMIVLAAAGVLHRQGLTPSTGFADRFIDQILENHFDPATGLLLNIPGCDICNVGHSIEFSGFAFEHLATDPEDTRISKIGSILCRSLEVGLQGPGIALSLSAKSGKAVSRYYPWWPMPEAIRACALGLRLGGEEDLLQLWQRADTAFFDNYLQKNKGYSFQTRTSEGPIDFVPATPDLDPAYHTALSLLTAAEAIDAETQTWTANGPRCPPQVS